jgi:hypothetical protein
MKNARRTFGVAGLVVLIAAVVAWYRFAPGEAPPGQPPLVTIDAATLEGLRTEFNGNANESRLIVLLSSTDVRRGYPTPTLLYADRDVFGMSVPKPPLPDPT